LPDEEEENIISRAKGVGREHRNRGWREAGVRNGVSCRRNSQFYGGPKKIYDKGFHEKKEEGASLGLFHTEDNGPCERAAPVERRWEGKELKRWDYSKTKRSWVSDGTRSHKEDRQTRRDRRSIAEEDRETGNRVLILGSPGGEGP